MYSYYIISSIYSVTYIIIVYHTEQVEFDNITLAATRPIPAESLLHELLLLNYTAVTPDQVTNTSLSLSLSLSLPLSPSLPPSLPLRLPSL